MKNTYNRFIGLLIIIKTLIPPVFLILFLVAISAIISGTGKIVSEGHTNISNNLDSLDLQVNILKDEVKVLKEKIEKAKDDATQFTADARRAIKPLTAALKGVQSVIKTVLGGAATVINEIIKAIKTLSFGDVKIPPLNLKPLYNLNLIPITFPELDLDFTIDMASVDEIKIIADKIQVDVETTAYELKTLYQTWFKIILFCLFLLILWALIKLIGFFLRIGPALSTGWRMLKGEQVEGALLYL